LECGGLTPLLAAPPERGGEPLNLGHLSTKNCVYELAREFVLTLEIYAAFKS